jgi:hypothetical protein
MVRSSKQYQPAILTNNNNFSYCFDCLSIIRNNLFHANKAFEADTPERLDFLLDWSIDFIKEIFQEEGDLKNKSIEIKRKLCIQNY